MMMFDKILIANRGDQPRSARRDEVKSHRAHSVHRR
jgi:hypothetical protein